MTSPYPGSTFPQLPNASQLTGVELVAITQSGVSKRTTVSAIVATVSSGGGSITQVSTGSGLLGGPVTSSGTLYVDIGAGLAFSGNQIIATGTGQGTVTQVNTSTGLAGGPVTSVGTITLATIAASTILANPTSVTGYPSAVSIGTGLAFSGSTLITSGAAGGVTSVFTRTGAVSAASGDYSFPQISGTVVLSTQVSGNLPFVNIQSCAPTTLLGNPTGATSTPSLITLGANLSFSGTTLVAAAGTGGGSGTVTQISTGTGLTGGPITSSGTILFATIAPSSLWANVSTATNTPVVTTLGAGLAFSGTTIINTSGSVDGVSSIATGTGLTGGTITSAGTISFASIAARSLWTNVSTGTAVPVVTTLGGGLAFSGTTIINTSGAVDGVSSVASAISGSGLSVTGSPVTSAGTFTFALANDMAAIEALNSVGFAVRVGADSWDLRSMASQSGISILDAFGTADNPTFGIADNGVTDAMIRQGAASTLIGNPTTGTANVRDITLGSGLAFSGTTMINTSGGVGGGTSLGLVYAVAAGNLMF
jgi:hypothetical protein